MIAATIAPLALADGDPARAVALASILAILVGVVMVVAGLAHMGFIADLLSKPTQIGYMNGLATDDRGRPAAQAHRLLCRRKRTDPRDQGFLFRGRRRRGQRHGSHDRIASLVGILLLTRLLPKVPAVLVVVVVASIAVNVWNLQDHGVNTIGVLPQGLPALHHPDVSIGLTSPPLFLGAVAIAVVALADTMSTASVLRRAQAVTACTETRRWSGSARPTSRLGFSRGSP